MEILFIISSIGTLECRSQISAAPRRQLPQPCRTRKYAPMSYVYNTITVFGQVVQTVNRYPFKWPVKSIVYTRPLLLSTCAYNDDDDENNIVIIIYQRIIIYNAVDTVGTTDNQCSRNTYIVCPPSTLSLKADGDSRIRTPRLT